MKANETPEKLYISYEGYGVFGEDGSTERTKTSQIEYIYADAFIEKALKWYCCDCECNDNCAANHKCAFRDSFEMYLKGNENALPPKFENALDPEGFTTENYRYRHFINKLQGNFIEKACEFLKPIIFSMNLGDRPDTDKFIEDFKNYMKGE